MRPARAEGLSEVAGEEASHDGAGGNRGAVIESEGETGRIKTRQSFASGRQTTVIHMANLPPSPSTRSRSTPRLSASEIDDRPALAALQLDGPGIGAEVARKQLRRTLGRAGSTTSYFLSPTSSRIREVVKPKQPQKIVSKFIEDPVSFGPPGGAPNYLYNRLGGPGMLASEGAPLSRSMSMRSLPSTPLARSPSTRSLVDYPTTPLANGGLQFQSRTQQKALLARDAALLSLSPSSSALVAPPSPFGQGFFSREPLCLPPNSIIDDEPQEHHESDWAETERESSSSDGGSSDDTKAGSRPRYRGQLTLAQTARQASIRRWTTGLVREAQRIESEERHILHWRDPLAESLARVSVQKGMMRGVVRERTSLESVIWDEGELTDEDVAEERSENGAR